MSVIKDGKTYLTIEEMDAALTKMAQVNAKKFAKEVVERQKESQKQYV